MLILQKREIEEDFEEMMDISEVLKSEDSQIDSEKFQSLCDFSF